MVPHNFDNQTDWEQEEAQVINTFLTELSDFWYCQGVFAPSNTWIIAQDENVLTHIWYEKYSRPETKVVPLPVLSLQNPRVQVVQRCTGNRSRDSRKVSTKSWVQRPWRNYPFLWCTAMNRIADDCVHMDDGKHCGMMAPLKIISTFVQILS